VPVLMTWTPGTSLDKPGHHELGGIDCGNNNAAIRHPRIRNAARRNQP
jgi:hypothetical protein